jgi:hypothetical protein
MNPLHEDQIHAPAFQRICDYIWSPDPNCAYVNSVIREHNPNLKIFNAERPLNGKGVIFVGQCQLIETCFKSIPEEGSYIVIHRTNDRSFTEGMYKKKPQSVKHIYTVDCGVNYPDVSAIPIGLATITGEDEVIKKIAAEAVEPAKTKVFVRYNVNRSGYTKERIESLTKLRSLPFCKAIEHQIPADQFFRQIKAHRFTMSLRGQGADAMRTWQAIALGSIPIVSDCIEMRHFEDLPILYYNGNITEEWLDSQSISGKSTKRMRMSYWNEHVSKNKAQL